nr:M14 family zinc carboxypeptidase [Methylomarinum sp. Ch1-1]MDP4519728.1 M14 family zinc carboxypeptidase [Methylomarinum sp. Ch1-1]
MSGQSIQERLPELGQIEAIIGRDHKQYLSTRVLCRLRYGETSLPIHALTLGNTSTQLPSLTLVGGIHGLERIGTQVVLTFLETLLERLHWDLTLVDMLQRVRINVLPLINPIGMLNHSRANGQGIDLMRNAPVDSDEHTVWLGGGIASLRCCLGTGAKRISRCRPRLRYCATIFDEKCCLPRSAWCSIAIPVSDITTRSGFPMQKAGSNRLNISEKFFICANCFSRPILIKTTASNHNPSIT